MNSYIKSLKEEGYVSLREEYYDNLNSFPTLGKANHTTTQDPDAVDKEDQTINGDDDDETEEGVEELTAETTAKELGGTADDESTTGEPLYEKLQDLSVQSPPGQVAQEEHPTEQVIQEEQTSDKQTKIDSTDNEHLNDELQVPSVQSPLEQVGQGEQPLEKQTRHDSNDTKLTGTKMKIPYTHLKKGKDVPNPIPIISTEESVKNVQNRLNSDKVTVSLLKPPSSKSPATPTTPNQALFPPQSPSLAISPSSNPSQGLSVLEFPLIRFITESDPSVMKR